VAARLAGGPEIETPRCEVGASQRDLTVGELTLPWAHLSVAKKRPFCKTAVGVWGVVSVCSKAANGAFGRSTPSAATAARLVEQRPAAGTVSKRIGVIGPVSRASAVGESRPAGIGSAGGSANPNIARLVRATRAIPSLVGRRDTLVPALAATRGS